MCRLCAQPAVVRVTDDYLWWWLEQFGRTRNGLSVRAHVRVYGLPEPLAEMADLIYGPKA